MSSSGGATSFAHSRAVTNLNVEDGYSIKGSIPKSILWIYGCSSLCDGGFILGAVHNPILLVVCGGDTLFLSLQLRFGILIY
uniref:Uncharacterized protein n=1 Tax=Oryza rufipogon TaxID=4529 RepID=A0A0E0QFX4_ORYRU